MTRKPRKKSAARAFLDLLWRQPLITIPFALFFGTIQGATLSHYVDAFIIGLFFTFTIGLTLWAIDHFVVGLHPELLGVSDAERAIRATMIYGGASLLATYLAALLLRFTIAPSFLGSVRDTVILGMYSVLFASLFMGIALAGMFYRRAIGRARAEEELSLARRIQRSFLISQFPTGPRFEMHALNVSSKEVSGDFYDVVPAGEFAFLLAIADVAGKGVPAALLSSMLQASLRTQANTVSSVAAILRNINTLVYRSTTVSQFATFFLARVEEATLRLSYTNAGHNYPIVCRPDGRHVTLERGGTVVGILESAEFEEGELQLVPGDRVVFYTDGISEAESPTGEMFGEDRLNRLLAAMPRERSSRGVIEDILAELKTFLDGEDPGDDMTLMVLRVLENGLAGG